MATEGDQDGYLMPEVGEAEQARRRAARERSLSNLKPFEPGQSGNPAGRRTAGATVTEELHRLMHVRADGPAFTLAEIKVIAEDPGQGVATVVAARQILAACQDGERFSVDRLGIARKTGTDPEPGRAADRIMDRTEGKPIARLAVANVRDPAEIQDELAALLQAEPGLARQLVQLMPEYALAAAEHDEAGKTTD